MMEKNREEFLEKPLLLGESWPISVRLSKLFAAFVIKRGLTGCLILLPLLLCACVPHHAPPAAEGRQTIAPPEAPLEIKQAAESPSARPAEDLTLPVRFQQTGYVVKAPEQPEISSPGEELKIPVGADISSTAGPIALRDILKRLALLKNMNVSWASDVDQYALVDVDIRAEDDFFKSIENLLRQKDYFYEIQGNSIAVGYKETRKFHIAMPFMASTFATGVGGDVLGSSGAGNNVTGNIQITSADNSFDIWDNITKNLDQVLEIWTEDTTVSSPAAEKAATGDQAGNTTTATVVQRRGSGKGYYTIDRPIGLITVTAPRPLLEKVAAYLDNLKTELYRQISIEAKILEVTLEDNSNTGIDWSSLLDNSGVNFHMEFGNNGQVYPSGKIISKVSLDSKSFTLLLNAIKKLGRTKVLANPKISVLNGQPALISVGDNVTYIDKVTSNVEPTSGVTTYSVTTSSVMSGLGLAVVPTIMNKDEIVLSLTPVTSELQEPIEYRQFGGDNQVGLPVVKLRELNTLVRIKSGELLVVGGLISKVDDTNNTKVPLLGDLPLINKLFQNEAKTNKRKELIILLRPEIIS